ncbi:MAG: DUF72 domain-containing protein, partial [Myxococcota bacterium]
AAYARHPLLRAVGIDRTQYAPVGVDQYHRWACAVPEDFRFLVKAHDELTLHRFSRHPRHGARQGALNPHFLDATYARDAVVGPTVEGLGPKLGVILFQFAAQDLAPAGGASGFVARLHRFLTSLPHGPRYAVEMRNPEVLGDEYRDALLDTGVSHCLNAVSGMPTLREQVHVVREAVGPLVVLRWLLPRHLRYEEAYRRFSPFSSLVEEDPHTRRDLVDILARAEERGREVMVIVNNKAEGCAPRSIVALARALGSRRDPPSPAASTTARTSASTPAPTSAR